jgi:putative oxidoreductase
MFDKLFSSKINEFVSPDAALIILRIGTGALMLTHGFPKLMRILDGNFSFGDPIGIGPLASLILVTFAEFLCSLFVMAGLFTRASLIPLMFAMAVAAFIAHAGDPFGDKELSLFFLISFITLFLTGPGKYSLDHKLFGK